LHRLILIFCLVPATVFADVQLTFKDGSKKCGPYIERGAAYCRTIPGGELCWQKNELISSKAVERCDHSDSAAIAKTHYELTENSYVDPKLRTYGIKTYAVLPAEHYIRWLDTRPAEGQKITERNTDKVQHMIQHLGFDCVKRTDLTALSQKRNVSLAGLTNEKAQAIGQLAHADAVVIISIIDSGVDYKNSTVFEEMNLRAVSVATGKILWKSILKGSVEAEYGTYHVHEVLDTIETKLYERLGSKLK
jgi:hypothetical protein